MRVEVGKRYVMRNGTISEPVEANPYHSKFPFCVTVAGWQCTYPENGMWLGNHTPSPYDLVCEHFKAAEGDNQKQGTSACN